MNPPLVTPRSLSPVEVPSTTSMLIRTGSASVPLPMIEPQVAVFGTPTVSMLPSFGSLFMPFTSGVIAWKLATVSVGTPSTIWTKSPVKSEKSMVKPSPR